MSQATDGITTASVPAPAATRLAPVGSIPNSNSQYGAPATVSQAYPGDLRSPSRSAAYDPTSTGSVARTVSSPDNLVARGQLPAVNTMPTGTVGSTGRTLPSLTTASIGQPRAVVPSNRPQPVTVPQVASAPQQPFPGDVAGRNTMAPDPIITGTAPRNSGWSSTGGSRVTLGQGETVSSVSRRYGVPIDEIMKANGLADASKVRAGQQLLIPVYVYGSSKQASSQQPADKSGNLPTPSRAPVREVAVLPTVPQPRSPQGAAKPVAGTDSASATPQFSGTHVVQSGDTLTRIAYANGVSVDALKAANGLTTASIRIGQKLRIPNGSTATSTPDPVQTASVQPKSQAAAPAPKVYTAPAASAGKDNLTETAKIDSAAAPASTGIGKLRWPGRGQLITGFAKSEDGRRNDGIDISMPVGSAVKAAENGVVIYSGDGLKEYGNTVLIRHDNGLVTVYAHAQSLNVSRGDKVQRGQTIASSGMSGVAKTPRLHFEVRKDATPVDPTTYLE